MRELTLVRKNKLEWREKKEPVINGSLEAIVRPFVASRCDGDSMFLFHNFSWALKAGVNLHYLDKKVIDVFGKNPLKPPFCVGHECIGEVMETGDEVSHFKKGDVVVVPWAISCGTCPTCASGYYSNCRNTPGNRLISAYGFGEGMGDWGGAVSDLLRVPFADAMLIALPAGINPYHCSSLSDNIADAYRTVGPQLKNRPGAPVLIMGGLAKSIGLYAASLAVALGSARVDYVDYSADRLRLAESVGANAIQVGYDRMSDRLSDLLPEGYPITVDASGSIKKLAFALRMLSTGGFSTGIAFYLRKGTPLPVWDMYTKSATFHTGVSHPRRDIPEILPLIQNGKFKPEKIITLAADWESAPQAYLEKTTKVVLTRKLSFAENKLNFSGLDSGF